MSDPRAPLSPEQVEQCKSAELVDRDGTKTTLGAALGGKKTLVIFIRHFWCTNCQTYVRQVSERIPPSSLPDGLQVVVIGCGSWQPIKTYEDVSSSAYPVYGNPTLSLYKLFGFKASGAQAKKGEGEYLEGSGGFAGRTFTALKHALRHTEHTPYVGPKTQNGGEVVFEADGSCSFIHRMQNVGDHIEVPELASLVGAKCVAAAT